MSFIQSLILGVKEKKFHLARKEEIMPEENSKNLNFLLLKKAYNKLEEEQLVWTILKSPLELGFEVIKKLYENKFSGLVGELDLIKGFSAGIKASSRFDSKIAQYHKNLFKFHQFYHSSYRARQGKVLEVLISKILEQCQLVIYSAEQARKKLKEHFPSAKIGKADIDVFATNSDKIIIIQLRSRDDTGGTTAKASLVKLLKKIYDKQISPEENRLEFLYLIHIFNSDASNQKDALIDSITEYLDLKEDSSIRKNISNQGLKFNNQITLKLTYGEQELAETIANFFNINKELFLEKYNYYIELLSNWDDLWVSYLVSSFELKNFQFNNFTSIDYLKNLLVQIGSQIKLNLSGGYDDLIKSIEDIKRVVAENWREEKLIPVSTLADQIFYVELLLYIHSIYELKNKITF